MDQSQESTFFSLLNELAAFFDIEAFGPTNQPISANSLVGNIEFSAEDGKKMRFQIEHEEIYSWQALRLRAVFALQSEEKEWIYQPYFLKAFLVSRILPGTHFPIAPSILSDDSFEFQMLLPLEEQSREKIFSFISFSSNFYHEAFKHIREIGFTPELTIALKKFDHAANSVWTLGGWERLKESSAKTTLAIEDFSQEGHYYRLLSPTENSDGMVAINLGSLLDFPNYFKFIPLILKVNAIAFYADHYYVAFDDRGGVLLSAALPAASKNAIEGLLTSLLERAVIIRNFLQTITKELETLHIQQTCKSLEGVEELIFT